MDELDKNELVVEICGEKNENVKFLPLQRKLRGRLSIRNLILSGLTPREGSEGIQAIDEVPGMHITLNVQTRTGRVLDPLGYKSNRKLMADINRLVGRGTKYAAVEPMEQTDLTDDQMATWCYWMQELVKAKLAVTVQLPGGWPKLKGRILVDAANPRQGDPRYKDEFDKMKNAPAQSAA